MKLKSYVAKIEEVPEAFRELYVKSGDGFILDTDDQALTDTKKKLDEFRSNNIKLTKERDELTETMKKFEGIDPAKYAEAKDALDKIDAQEESALMKAGKFDVLRQKWTQETANGFTKKLTAAETAAKAAEDKAAKKAERLNTLLLEQHAVKTISEIGTLRQGALKDYLNRVRESYAVGDDELPTPKDGVVDEAGKPLPLEGFGKKLLTEASYLFEGSGGGGSGGGRKQDRTGKVSVIGSSPLDFGKNLEGIAKGTVVVDENR